jgi:HEAT repeat protein
MSDLETETRRVAAASAGFDGDEATARRLTGDAAPIVRAAAFASLLRLGAFTRADLATATGDPSPQVRAAIAELASGLGAGHDPAAFRDLLHDSDAVVVEAACFATGEVGDLAAVGALIEIATSHADPLCREAAVAALGALGSPEGKAAVLAALGDRPEIRRRAVVALTAFEGPDVVEALRGRLEDRDWQVRQAAEDVLGISAREER